MRNLNLLFNKEYYQTIGTETFNDDIVKHNKDILSAVFTEKDYIPSAIAKQSFILATQYPGLLIGVGNPHGAGNFGGGVKDDSDKDDSSEDVNLGFSFDYVTGQPYIPGSSVKGLLRSFFKYYPDRANPVEEILHGKGFDGIGMDDVKALEKAVFEHADIFLDAVVYDGNEYGQLMGFDFITPQQNPVASPKPIRIIKVLPDVRFEFRFVLSDKRIREQTLTADALKELFKELLILFGAGAKTNVGYGILDTDASNGIRTPKKKASVPQSFAQKKPSPTQKSKVPRVTCPQCGFSNYKFRKDGVTLTDICYKCQKPLR